ncbi:MAG: hypothetical protein IT356_08655 [Gemmatimonadaceae bacterium]|nr:hypothetical protein [Gemmatimonadaceae bacterium]
MMPHSLLQTRIARTGAVAVLAVLASACGSPNPPDLSQRLWTDDYEIRVLSDPSPPLAQEPVMYTIFVRDKKTKEPIVNGQGRIFATNADRHSIWQAFTYGPEVGTYHSRLLFVTAGEWAMGVQFRRDTSTALQQTLDWRQMVRPGSPFPSSDTAR